MNTLIPGLATAAAFTTLTVSAQTSGGPRTADRPSIPAVYLLYPAPNGTSFDVNS